MMILDSTCVVGAAPETCAGCPVAAKVNQEIVNFALSKLGSSDGNCSREKVQVENFQSQVRLYHSLVFVVLYCVLSGGGRDIVQV